MHCGICVMGPLCQCTTMGCKHIHTYIWFIDGPAAGVKMIVVDSPKIQFCFENATARDLINMETPWAIEVQDIFKHFPVSVKEVLVSLWIISVTGCILQTCQFCIGDSVKRTPQSLMTYPTNIQRHQICDVVGHFVRYVVPVVMMTSSNGNIFRVTGHLCGEFTGPRWIPHTKASDAELWCLLWSAPE